MAEWIKLHPDTDREAMILALQDISTVSFSTVGQAINSNPLGIAWVGTCPSSHASDRSSIPHYAAAPA
jgi:hypothetical protein